VVDGVVGGQVGGGGFGDAGDDGGHLLLDGAVVGTEGFLVVLERDPEELVLQLQRLRQLRKVRRLRRRGVGGGGGGGGDRGSGGVVAVGKGIHFHWEQRRKWNLRLLNGLDRRCFYQTKKYFIFSLILLLFNFFKFSYRLPIGFKSF